MSDITQKIKEQSEIRQIIEEVLSLYRAGTVKPLEEEALYRTGLLSGENSLLKERIKDLEEENSLLKEKIMALPSLIEKAIDKIKVSDRGVKSDRDSFYFSEARKIGEERTSQLHTLRVKMFDLFKKIPLFSRLGEKELHYLLEKTYEKNYGRDSMILQRGDKSGFLGVLLSGELKVTMLSPEGREMTLDILKPYCAIGEMSLLDDEPHSATVIAMKKSRLLILQREPFLELLKRTPETCLYLLRQQVKLVRRLNEQISDLKFMDIYQRTAKKLVSLCPSGEDHTIEITHQELANFVGSNRENVTRALSEMDKNGLIYIKKGKIIVKDMEGLKTVYS